MLTRADACLTAPDPTSGVVIGPGVRLVVEVAVRRVRTGVLWDRALWDRGRWGGDVYWYDVACDVREVTTDGGRTSPLDRPRVAVAQYVIDDPAGAWIPDATVGPFVVDGVNLVGPGVAMRSGVVVDGVWRPWHTGPVESIVRPVDAYTGPAAVVTVVDPLAELATVDGLEQPPAGNRETAGPRLDRLLEAAAWRWPRRLDPGTVPLQSTTRAGNRLGECYLTADSSGVDAVFVADPDGAARFRVGTRTGSAPPAFRIARCATVDTGPPCVPWVRLRPSWDTDRIVNVAIRSRAGGTAKTAQDPGSVARFGPFVDERLDLICAEDDDVEAIAEQLVARRAWDDRRIDEATLRADVDDRFVGTVAGVTVDDRVDVVVDTIPGRPVTTYPSTVAGLSRRYPADGPYRPGMLPDLEVAVALEQINPGRVAAVSMEVPAWL